MTGPTVVVAGGTIAAVHGPAGPLPAGAHVVDLPGLTLMPGLVDAHLHLCFDASSDPVGRLADTGDDVLRERMAEAARRALRAGVTTVRDLGDRGYLALDMRDQSRAGGAGPLPAIVAAGPPITTPGGHCHFLGGAASGERALRAAVRDRAERGVDVIKVMASGGNMTPGSLAQEPQFGGGSLRAIVDEAHRHGLPVTAHAHSARSIADAVAGGVDGIEHATFMTAGGVDAPEALIRAIAAQRIAVGWTVGRDPGQAGTVPPQIASRMAALITNRRRLYESGAVIVPGSDAGVTPAKPHDVLPYAPEELAAAGLGPAEILQAMTSRAAQAYGLGHRKGRIAPGFDADILAIDGNPLEDLAAIRKLRGVRRRPARHPRTRQPGRHRGAVMPRPAPALGPGQRPPAPAEPHLMPLAGEWALWRDLAVRTAGFPVSGLGIFGSGDEQAGLRAVARDPLFQTAVTWQNRAAMRNAVGKIAGGSPAPGSRQRQREEVVASYWQRYCAKNDTIGFFGPLAWGRLADDGPAIQARCGQLVAESTVHFEAWAMQALAEALDADLTVPVGPHSERDLRSQLERSRPDLRQRGLAALDRLERCRSAAARAADPGALDEALGDLDRGFEDLTGRPASRRPGQTYAARTLLYLDCMRDLDLTVGPALRDELAVTLPPLLAGARWYSGRVYEAARQIIGEATAAAGTRPLDRVLEEVLPALRHLPQKAAAANGDLQRRWSVLLANPDPATIAARAAAAFADHTPAWPVSVYQSADVQIAARSQAAVNAGDYLCVVGDFHPGANPLGQGVFATRHPDRERFLDAIASDVGTLPFLIPARDVGMQTTRNMPAVTRPSDMHVAATPRDRMPDGYRTWHAADLITDGEIVTTPDGSWRAPLAHLLWLPMLIAGVHAYDPFPVSPADGHGPRITIGRTVWRRETWDIPAEQGPARPETAATCARDRGLPRRVFALSPSETKPVYIDFDSPVLTRILCRQLRRAAADDPGRPVRFTEMLPGPDDCWLADQDGWRYTSELRLVVVDLGRKAPRSVINGGHDDVL